MEQHDGMAWLRRLGASPWLIGIEVAGVLLASSLLAVVLQPEPFSDWLYYWHAAGHPERYERGGLMLMLVGLLKPLGLPPHLTMLLPNQLAAMVILLIARQIDLLPGKWLSHLTAAYLLLLTPYFGLVQLDLMAAACLALGWRFLLRPPNAWRAPLAHIVAMLAFAAAVSTRPQFLLVLLTLVGMLALVWMVGSRPWRRDIPVLLAPLVIGALGGFAIDSSLRAQADRAGAIRTNSAVTLYSGLLVSSTTYPLCGQWSPDATDAMRADLGKPLSQAIVARLRAQPIVHWVAVGGCKLRQIIAPPAFAWWWLQESPNVRGRLRSLTGAGMSQTVGFIRGSETWLYRGVMLLIYGAAAIVAWRGLKQRSQLLLPALWMAAFWTVHLVFEVQGRYFLSTLLIVPILCALLLRDEADPTRRRERVTEPTATAVA